MITNEQREQRKNYIGSSDAAALCGYDPWRNSYDLWLDKTGKLEGGNGSRAADIGTDLEEALIRMFERGLDVKHRCHRDISLSRNDGFPACANLDAAIIVTDHIYQGTENGQSLTPIEAVVEAKSTSRQDEWNIHSGEVPLRVLIQTHWQMWVSGAGRAWVPVLFPDFGRFRFEVFPVERNDQLIEELVYRAAHFWKNHVLRDIPPQGTIPHLETLGRIRRVPQTVVELDGKAVELQSKLDQAKAACKELERNIESLKAEIVARLGDAEAGTLPDGAQITYLEQSGSRNCDFDLLHERLRQIGHEQIYTELVSQPRFRVLRHKKAR